MLGINLTIGPGVEFDFFSVIKQIIDTRFLIIMSSFEVNLSVLT